MRFSKYLPVLMAAGLSAAGLAQQSGAPDEAPSEAGQNTTQSRLEEELRRQVPAEEERPPSPTTAEPAVSTPPDEPSASAAEAEAPAADAPAAPAPPLTRAQIAELERTAERGRQLIAIARAGIVATQDMLSRVSDPDGAGISGWIAEPEGNAMKVTFYAIGEGAAAGARAVYRANVLGGRVVSRDIFLGEDRPALTPIEARMAAARAAVTGLDHRPCDGQFNYLVVPPASASAPVDVYQVTAPTRRGHFPLGGHFRSTVAVDGTVSDSRGFARGCVDLEAAEIPAGQQPRPIGVTHLLDPMPTEIHLFLSQLTGRPLLVATGEPQRIWLVTPERIAEVRP